MSAAKQSPGGAKELLRICRTYGAKTQARKNKPPRAYARGYILAPLRGFLLSLTFFAVAFAQAPAPPGNVAATDHPWDNGTRVDLQWQPSSDDAMLRGYMVRRKGQGEAAFAPVDLAPPGATKFTVNDLTPGQSYTFEVAAVSKDGSESAPVTTGAVAPKVDSFDGTRIWFLLTLVIFSGAVLAFIAAARRGINLKVRKIAGLEAVDEAVGRATEMGRSCLFIPGIDDMNNIQTIAGITVLSRVAKTAAEYDAKLQVPTSRSLVMTAARETTQAAFLGAGRPDAYTDDAIYYVTDEQFGYVAHLQGLMVREKPAACFYMGSFFAESLILAEMGNSIGAIQIAGTAQPAQLPFFVAACDYTLIGEEFFAASAYLSGEPGQIGSLKGQDVGKLIVAAGIIVGVIGLTLANLTGSGALRSFVDFLTQSVLS
jgi:hypothetical protein